MWDESPQSDVGSTITLTQQYMKFQRFIIRWSLYQDFSPLVVSDRLKPCLFRF